LSGAEELRAARDFLWRTRTDYQGAYAGFRWPQPDYFNFALDWIDRIAREGDKEALRIVFDDGSTVSRTYSALSNTSNRIANFLRSLGLRRGEAMLLMLNNVAELWEVMLAAMKVGIIVIPATPLISGAELADRLKRGKVRVVVTASELQNRFEVTPDWRGVSVGAAMPGWLSLDEADLYAPTFEPDRPTRAADPMLLYFTSGTTALPKLVMHSHVSYPIGCLSTMYWLGLQRADVHLNISSPGWAKHAWSCFFAPFLAEATVLVLNQARFAARNTLDTLVREGVTTFCAPPTVWRMIIQEDLSQWKPKLREAMGAGEPLNPEVIAQVRQAWGLTIRDGYGQTETAALIANSPGQEIVPGSVGRPMPGFQIVLRDADGNDATEAEICVKLQPERPVGLMQGYRKENDLEPITGDVYHTGDVASVSADGMYTYVGRADDVFKASDYRISPFELESVLIEHPAVGEAAVVPSPDPTRLAIPKAFVTLVAGCTADAETAASILAHARQVIGPFKRIRRIEFCELPKTISGKIRRVELRKLEAERRAANERGPAEWHEEDFPELSKGRS
jgi:acetyl-CoA synthetase